MANPGYGKRSAPDQSPPRPDDFAHLPAREAYLASFIDQLCENAAMDAKTIAKAQALYGQQAVRSALKELSRAGHLRRVRRRVVPSQESATGTRWVFSTYWSRTARANEWWSRFLDGDASGGTPEVAPAQSSCASGADTTRTGAASQAEQPTPSGEAHTSIAYTTLARLGLRDPRLALSSADCAALEQLVVDWFARGVTPEHLTQTLVAGLPGQIHSPGGIVRRRLVDKMPPEVPTTESRAPRSLMECTGCGVPGRPEALPGGLCRPCHVGDGGAPLGPPRTEPVDVRARAAQVRASISAPQPV
ncbi:hypothetical protein [Streptomyces sp. NPDC001843]|uniref:hypothetical protein n=1 Tax=Streptomyces sp. NPDC001843 TaxID=3364617 RepID=UPI0036B9BE5B